MSSQRKKFQFRRKRFRKAVLAIRNNDTDALKDILNCLPEFSTMVDNSGRNLLQLCVIHERLEMFDYLLSLNCFDLEATDNIGDTILQMVLSNSLKPETCNYFSTRLINAGANVHTKNLWGSSYLHLAASKKSFETAELLIQKGIQINAQNISGCTALHSVLKPHCYECTALHSVLKPHCEEKINEGVSMLLHWGVDHAIHSVEGHSPFDRGVINGLEDSTLEHLFYNTIDSYSEYKLSSEILCILVRGNSPLIDKILQVVSEIVLYDNYFEAIYFNYMKPDSLRMMIDKFSSFIRVVLLTREPSDIQTNIDSLEILLHSELRSETIEYISKMNFRSMIFKDGESLGNIIETFSYLLTYGLSITPLDYEYVYENAGYCDLFTTMLHMSCMDEGECLNMSMLRIICDIHCDLEDFLPNLISIPSNKLEQFLDYFAHPLLRSFCEEADKANLVTKAKRLPQIPSLIELARNTMRRYLVNKHKLEKTSQYYSLLKRLKIGTTYEKILSFETKLY